VRIGAEERANEWVSAVRDNGIGIDPKYFDKIFVIFRGLYAKGGYMGTGMGLSIVKKNIENLGGKIWVVPNPGGGSTVYFTLLKHVV
jgi:light-regulated signal transduction histidine kinase (bacteriophytochrome)